jgi:1-deoxy-D-xylulose-5-phosphate synthase
MARARTLRKENRHIICVIGDGALTGGMAYEALNDAGQSGEPLIVILNDNNMSINKNVGALAKRLAKLRITSALFQA